MAPTRRKVAIIPMKPDYNKDSVEYVKHRRAEQQDGVTEEIQERVPVLQDDSTAYQTLEFFAAFEKCRRHMEWNTGPRHYQRFGLHLTGSHLTNWEAQIDGADETVDEFDEQLGAFKLTLLQGYKYGDQMDALREMKKPRDQTPSQFLLAFRAAESRAVQLPDAPNNAGFTDDERIRIFFKAMPSSWQDKFDDANMRVENEELGDIRQYFDKQQQKDPYIDPNKKSDGNGGNNTN